MVVVTGGVGKLAGTILASAGLGGLTKGIEPALGAVFGKVAILVGVILFLQRRPAGLFATRGRNAEASGARGRAGGVRPGGRAAALQHAPGRRALLGLDLHAESLRQVPRLRDPRARPRSPMGLRR